MVSVLSPSKKNISLCADLIRSGKLVVFPTETVYGLGANAFLPDSVEKIFVAKRRPKKNPTIVHVSSWKMLSLVIGRSVSKKEKRFLSRFWPGPLTVLFLRSPRIPDIVTAGLPTVAVRWPSNRIARQLISMANVPVAAPSANPSSKPSPTLSRHVKKMKGVSAILDGGPSVFGIESTVLDLENQVVLRPGPVGISELKPWLPDVRFHASLVSDARPKKVASPGMRYKHYSPACKITVVTGFGKKLASFFNGLPRSVPVICSSNVAKNVSGRVVFSFSSASDLGKRLFAFFHALDDAKIKRAVVQGVPERGIGFSVMNRLKKAASKRLTVS